MGLLGMLGPMHGLIHTRPRSGCVVRQARAASVAAVGFPMAGGGHALEAADRSHPGTRSTTVDGVPGGGLH